MAFCPADLKPCIDDLCYGSGCLRLGGEPMLEPCMGCGQLVTNDGSNRDYCDCEPGDDLDDGRDDDYGDDE